MKKMILCLAGLGLTLTLFATLRHEIGLPAPQIGSRGEFATITLEGAQPRGEAGTPALPWVGVTLLLPLGEQADRIQVQRSQPVVFQLDQPLEPLQPQQPISQSASDPPVSPDPAIYATVEAYPASFHTEPGTQFLAGHPLCFAGICPFEYYPASGILIFYQRLSLSVEHSPGSRAQAALALLKQDRHTMTRLSEAIDNPSALPRYELPSFGTEYIIIHDSARQTQWQPLMALHAARGLNVQMKPVQEIYSEYSGADNQAKIRNYIIAMYAANSLHYVFLAGDAEIIPYRGFYATTGSYTNTNIPADVYYACLDGNWNTDGDSYWGEMHEADLIPELAVGRYCYNSDAEIASFIAKVDDYLNAPDASNIKRTLLLGELLNSNPLTWGGDCMDELKVGSSANGYTTTGFPADWSVATLYDRDQSWGINQLKPLISAGYNFVNHLGHGNYTSALGIAISDVTESNFTNDGDPENFSIMFSQACYAGGFDQSDSIAEKFMSIGTSAVAMLANSRYGWYSAGSTNGSSQHFHREFIDSFCGENILELGNALNDCKVDCIPFILNSGVMHWCHYEINLLGDPAMPAWTDTPQTVSAQLPSAWTTGLDHYQITTNAPSANLRIKDGANFLYEGVTAADGSLYLHLPQVVPPGTYDFYINANNFFSYHTQVSFEASSEAYATCSPVVFVDADALHHTGEEIGLTVTVSNVGQQDQSAAGSLTLSCASPNVQILTASCGFGPLAIDGSQLIEGVFEIELTGEFEDTSQAQLVLTAVYDGISTESHAWLTLNAPQLVLSAYQASNPAWHIEPGDSPQLTVYLANQGSGYAYSPVLTLSSDDPHAELSTGVLYPSQLAPQSGLELSDAFSLEISDTAPLDTPILIDYELDAENGDAYTGVIKVYVSRAGYHFENSWMGYATEELASGFVNQWHRSQSRNHSVNGSCAMKFGGPLLGNYGSSAYGALVSPSLSLGDNATLRFQHWMDAELDADPDYAWDGGLVQISLEGGDWQPLTPLGGYPCLIKENPACPFAADTPVYSGSFDWTEAEFDLSAYSGNAAFRWVFGSDSSVTGAGWYIDDVSLDQDPPLPVELSSFTASVNNSGQIGLTWVTQSENGVSGYRVLRHTAPELAAAVAVSDLIPACNGIQQQLYFFLDEGVEIPGWYHYWLLQADLDGGDCYYGPVSIDYAQPLQSAPGLPLVTGLDAAYPNPFNAQLFLPYALAREEIAMFKIYNQRGQLVRMLDNGRQAPGRYQLEWDGNDDSGRGCASGVYRIVMQAGREQFRRQAVLLK